MADVTTLYDDEHGLDLRVDSHNVNLRQPRECLSVVTHTSRDGLPMEVRHYSGSYFILVSATLHPARISD